MQETNGHPTKAKKSLSIIIHNKWHKIKGVSKTNIQTKKIDEELENLLEEIDYLTRNKSYITSNVANDFRGIPAEDVLNFQHNSKLFFENHNQPVQAPNISKLPYVVEFYQDPGKRCICKPCPQDKNVSTDPLRTSQLKPPSITQQTQVDESRIPAIREQEIGRYEYQKSQISQPSGNLYRSDADKTFNTQLSQNQDTYNHFQPAAYSSPANLVDNSQPFVTSEPPDDWTIVDRPQGYSLQETRNISFARPMPMGQQLSDGRTKWLDCSATQATNVCPATGTGTCCTCKKEEEHIIIPRKKPQHTKIEKKKKRSDSSIEEIKICVQNMDLISDSKALASNKFSPCMKSDCPCTVLTHQQLKDQGIDVDHIQYSDDSLSHHKKSKKKAPKKKKEKKKSTGCFSCCKKKKKHSEVQHGVQANPVTRDKTQQVLTRTVEYAPPPAPVDYPRPQNDPVRVIIKPAKQCEPLCPAECSKQPNNGLSICASLKEFVKRNAQENSQYMENILEELREQRKELKKINDMYEACIRNFTEGVNQKSRVNSLMDNTTKSVGNSLVRITDANAVGYSYKNTGTRSTNKKTISHRPLCKCYDKLENLNQFKRFPNNGAPYAAQYVVSTQWMYFHKGDTMKQIKNIMNESRLLYQPSNLLERKQNWIKEEDVERELGDRNKIIIRQLRNASTSTEPHKDSKKQKKLDLALIWIKHSVNSLRKKRVKKERGSQTS